MKLPYAYKISLVLLLFLCVIFCFIAKNSTVCNLCYIEFFNEICESCSLKIDTFLKEITYFLIIIQMMIIGSAEDYCLIVDRSWNMISSRNFPKNSYLSQNKCEKVQLEEQAISLNSSLLETNCFALVCCRFMKCIFQESYHHQSSYRITSINSPSQKVIPKENRQNIAFFFWDNKFLRGGIDKVIR